MFEKIPNMLILGNRPCHHDADAVTMLELAGTLHARFNEIVDECNTFTQNINNIVTNFKGETAEDQEAFRTALRQEFQDFIDIVNVKLETAFNTGTVTSAMKEYIAEELTKYRSDLLNNLETYGFITGAKVDEKIQVFNGSIAQMNTSITEFENHMRVYQPIINECEILVHGHDALIPELIARIEALESGSGGGVDTGGGDTGTWLFQNERIDTVGRNDLPIPVAGVSYTAFVDGEEIRTVEADKNGYVYFTTEDYRIYFKYEDYWHFHPIESQVQSGNVSIRINDGRV